MQAIVMHDAHAAKHCQQWLHLGDRRKGSAPFLFSFLGSSPPVTWKDIPCHFVYHGRQASCKPQKWAPAAWEQARLDYETLCELCRTLFAPAIQTHPKGVFLLQYVGFGSYLVPVALAIQYRGYGHWIDYAIAWANEFLSDPDLQAWLAKQLA